MPDLNADLAYCQSELRKLNPIHHFAALSAPKSKRADLMAFYAFLAELARIPRLVSEPGTGEIRLYWWKDVIANDDCSASTGCGAANIGPLGTALKHVQHRYNLPAPTLIQFIEARRFDLYNDPMPDQETFEVYAAETRALPIMMAAQILNDGDPVPEIAELCGDAGVAISLSNHLRRWPKVASYQKLFLPKDTFDDLGVTITEIFGRVESDNLEKAIELFTAQTASRHHEAMKAYRRLKQQNLQHLSALFLELALIPSVTRKRHSDPYTEIEVSPLAAYWAMGWMAIRS